MIKVYKKNNYIIIEDIITGRQFQGLCKKVSIFKDNINNDVYYFFGLINDEGLKGISLSQIIKEDNSPYSLSDWETFYTENTGNFNTGSGPIDPPNFRCT